jgi:protein involved in polysaccharide export with SLBB domain
MHRLSAVSRVLFLATAFAAFASAAEPAVNPAGTIAPGDLIEVSVAGLLAPNVVTPLQVRVDAAGRAAMPRVGLIEVGGQTTDAAAARVSNAFEKAQLIRNGVCTIAIIETAAKTSVPAGPVGVGDTLRVSIADMVAPGAVTVIHAQVGRDGTVTIPLAGAVKVNGMSEADAAGAVVKSLADNKVMQDAMVIVLRTSAGSGAGKKE